MDLLLFGDQTADQYPLLRKISQRKDNALLSTFLERVSVALRDEVTRLPRSHRDSIPDFLTVQHLVEAYYEKGLKMPQLESCLVTIAQLAHFIGLVFEFRTFVILAKLLGTLRSTPLNYQTHQTPESSDCARVYWQHPPSHLRDRSQISFRLPSKRSASHSVPGHASEPPRRHWSRPTRGRAGQLSSRVFLSNLQTPLLQISTQRRASRCHSRHMSVLLALWR